MKNPYPEKIFPPIEEEEWRRIDELLRKELGFPLDRVSGNIGRIVWNNLMEDVKSAVQGLLEEIERKKGDVDASLSKILKGEKKDTAVNRGALYGWGEALFWVKKLVKKWLPDVAEGEE